VNYDLIERRNIIRYDHNLGGVVGPIVDAVNALYSRRYRNVFSSTLTPQYGYKRRNGIRLPVNSYHLWKEDVRYPRGYPFLKLVWTPTGEYSEYFGPTRSGTGALVYFKPSNAQNDAMDNSISSKLLTKIKSQHVNIGNFIAERKQMMDMFSDTANRCARAFRSLKRGNIPGAFRALACQPSGKVNPRQSAANNWLALQYGWLPLISDVYGAAQQMTDTLNNRLKKPVYHRAVATERLHDETVHISPSGQDCVGATAHCEFIQDTRGVITYVVDVEDLALLGRVGLANPLAIAWEALPYSFIVDWALPIGNWINTLDATLGCTFVDGSRSRTLRSVFQWENKHTYTSGNFQYNYLGCQGDGRWFEYLRQPFFNGFPPVTAPQFKDPISKGHVANALALLSQAFKG
jgi:hypothetical protein